MESLATEVAYQAGDTIAVNQIDIIGRSTGNSGTVIGFMPLPKPCSASSATVSSSYCTLFWNGGYEQYSTHSIAAIVTELGLYLTITVPSTLLNAPYVIELFGLTIAFS